MTTLLQNLHKLKDLFESDMENGHFYAKLAFLELCGWIEEKNDDIVRNLGERCLHSEKCRKDLESEIKQVHSFSYEDGIRRLIIRAVGLQGVERTEGIIGGKDIDILTSKLKTLKLKRNEQAHTFISGVTQKLDAPSVTINEYEEIKELLNKIERALESIQ